MKNNAIYFAILSAILLNNASYSQVESIQQRFETANCNYLPPSENVFRLQFIGFRGQATLLPEAVLTPLTSNLKLLKDDRITNFSATLIGRKNKLISFKDNCYLQMMKGGQLARLAKLEPGKITIYRLYEWRNYSPGDLTKRTDLCKRLAALLLNKTLAGAVLSKSFKNIEKDLVALNREMGGSEKDFPFDFGRSNDRGLLDELISKNIAKSNGELSKMSNSVSEIEQVKKLIKELDAKYLLQRDTSFFVDYSHSLALTADTSSNFWLEVNSTQKPGFIVQPSTDHIKSNELAILVTDAPKILTLFSQGGYCGPVVPGGIKSSPSNCRSMGISSSFIDILTKDENMQCNDVCNTDCMNFLRHLAKRVAQLGISSSLQGIPKDDTKLCALSFQRKTSCDIIMGWFANTEQEDLCRSKITFNEIIDDYVKSGYTNIILLGQSLGGKKFADLVRDEWSWGTKVSVKLFIAWDATGLTGGVTSVGSKPEYVLNFFQNSPQDTQVEDNDDFENFPFQRGAHITQSDKEFDLTNCFTHNGIARSKFVHDTTLEKIKQTIIGIRADKRK